MAVVRSFAPSTQNVKPHKSEVDCEFVVIEGASADRLLHLSTFGSDDRASERKSSQSIQLDRKRAQELLKILVEAFPGIKPAAN